MKLPKKNNKCFPKNIPKKSKRKKGVKQPIPKSIDFWVNKKNYLSENDLKEMEKSRVTTSKLEYTFMRNFLDVLGIKYIHQFFTPAKFIYDFAILTKDGTQIDALIEVDGSFWHCDPRLYPEPIYENQKRQIQRDKEKNLWANLNNFILIRFKEYDIIHNPKDVLKELKKRFYSTSF
jgi:very-short-patch-repair endonuclease